MFYISFRIFYKWDKVYTNYVGETVKYYYFGHIRVFRGISGCFGYFLYFGGGKPLTELV